MKDANRVDTIRSPTDHSRCGSSPDEALGQIKGDVDYAGVAKSVFLATGTAKLMQEAGLTPPTSTTKSFAVMGKTFDPAKPEEYVNSFAIKRAS